METFYRLKVSIGKITFELESHDKSWVEEKEKHWMGNLLSNPERVAELARTGSSDEGADLPATRVDSNITINEYYRKYLSGKSLNATTVALYLIYYLEKIRIVDQISTNDVKSAFKEIAYPKYDKINFTDTCNRLKTKGYLNKIDGKWQLTLTGVDEVLSNLSGE